jgi:SAM-dependent methyltransferase
MALFERENSDFGADVATRALSVTAVENDFVERVYEKLASVYDLTFGPTLHPGRLQARDRMGIKPGDRILEVGVGTGINTMLYPRNCHITGIDLSTSMLEKARERVKREGLHARRPAKQRDQLRLRHGAGRAIGTPSPGARASTSVSAADHRWRGRRGHRAWPAVTGD